MIKATNFIWKYFINFISSCSIETIYIWTKQQINNNKVFNIRQPNRALLDSSCELGLRRDEPGL